MPTRRDGPAAAPAVIPVGIGEGRVAAGEGVALAVHGLGSCVALCLYDPVSRGGGLCHVVLPSSELGRAGDPPCKFADTAVGWLVEQLRARGASAARLVAKMAGGANLFGTRAVGHPTIGERNVAAVREALARRGIALRGEHVGGTAGRSIVFRLADGSVEVSLAGAVIEVL